MESSDRSRVEVALDDIATMFSEFGLGEARWETAEFMIAFRRSVTPMAATDRVMPSPLEAPVTNLGTPISSPMTGVFYAAGSPGSPPFVNEGDTVTAGDVVGLIEAMKVFNEIVATVSGTVLKVVAKAGSVVEPGEPLLYIG